MHLGIFCTYLSLFSPFSPISHSEKVETDHFITTIELDFLRLSDQALPVSEGFAFWFVAQNVSDTLSLISKSSTTPDWSDSLTRNGFGMNGVIPPNFKGVGVIFTALSSIVVITSDGSRPSSSFSNLHLKQDSISNFDFRKPGVKLTVSFNRAKGEVSVYVFDADKKKGTIEVKTNNIPATGFLGMTAFSGLNPTGDRILFKRMRSVNLDLKFGSGESILGELEKKLEDKNLHIEDLVSGESESSIEEQIQDVHKAVSIVSEYLSDTRERDHNIVIAMSEVQGKADELEALINELRMEIKYSFKERGGTGGLEHEIRGLHELIKFHSDENHSINALKDKLKSISSGSNHPADAMYKNLLDANTELEEEMSKANFNANLTIIVFGLVVLGLGLLLWIKMKQYEKRHFL